MRAGRSVSAVGRPRAGGLPAGVAPLTFALVVVGLVSGCGIAAETTARPVTVASSPALPSTPPGSDPSGPARERLFLLRDGALVRVARTTAQRRDARAVLADLLAGPSAEERERGLTTALPADAGVTEFRLEQGVALISLNSNLVSESGRTDQVLALGQIVSTLDALPEVTAVRFLQDGQPLNVPRGDSSLASVPVTANDYAALRSP